MRKLLLILFIIPISAVAQRDHIVSFREKLVVTGVLNTKSESFDFSNSIGQDLEYSTADITGIGLGVDYKWLTFEFTRRLKSASDDGLYGHTENFGIGFGFTMPKWYFRNFFEVYSGYHLTNPDFIAFNYLDSVGSYPYRPDITSTRYYATWNWVFNDENYSSLASLWQLERQERSGGSFVAGATYSTSIIQADSAFIPSAQEENFTSVANWNQMGYQAFGLNAGYQYTYVFKRNVKWFIHLGLTPGLGFSWSGAYNQASGDFVDLPSRAVFLTEGRLIVGYNGDKWYFGYSSIGYGTSAVGREINPISNFSSYNRFYVGYRFSLPEKISKPLERIGL